MDVQQRACGCDPREWHGDEPGPVCGHWSPRRLGVLARGGYVLRTVCWNCDHERPCHGEGAPFPGRLPGFSGAGKKAGAGHHDVDRPPDANATP